ncbi:type II toxin-antitoxin system YhaV family toxin [Desulfobacterales bacterium HSG2]|nr:type II toxin-antitoxin system YhaV family toxin [Desulfobacterales bacterium HSG2]
MKINQWNILFFKVFYEQYQALVGEVKELCNADPSGYKFHPKTKLLAAVQKAIKTDVPADPLPQDHYISSERSNKSMIGVRIKLTPSFQESLRNGEKAFFL